MSISNTTTKTTYLGNGSVTAFPIPFPNYTVPSDVVVIRRDETVPTAITETALVLGTDYTLTGGVPLSGILDTTVTFGVAPLATHKIIIKRVLPINQPVSYSTNAPFPAKTHEGALDREVLVSQQLQEQIDRSIKLSPTTQISAPTFPEPSAGVVGILQYDATGKLTQLPPVAGPPPSLSILTDVTVSGQISNQVLKWNGTKWVNANVSGTEVTSGASLTGQVLTSNGAGAATWQTPTVGTVGPGAITNTEVAAGAAIARNKLAAGGANVVVVNNGAGVLTDSAITTTQLGYLSTTTSDVQSQLNGKQASGSYITSLASDVVASGPGAATATIQPNVVDNSKTAQMPTMSIKGNNTAGLANALDLTTTQVNVMLPTMVGDAGSGGTKGLVPAPGVGDAAAGKFLKADGTWTVAGSGSAITATTGDVVATGPGSVAATIQANVVTNAKAAQMAANTLKGNNTGSTANASDLTVTQATAMLNALVGDSGAGGTKGLVPAPAAGDAAASKFLKADGTWATAGSAAPVTTKGDLYGFSTVGARVPVGTDGQVLQADSTQSLGVKWATAASGSGTNFVGLDSSWASTQTNDRGAEVSVGNWVAYNDGATALPVDLTGGVASGNVTLSRTTTAGEVLNGAASFKITKGAFNVQGEGFSVPFYIPIAYRNTNATISIPFKVISGSIVSGDVNVYVYDVTNSQLITPYNLSIVGNQGVLTATFPPNSTMAQGRLGIHFASTSASALTLAFDDVSVAPGVAAYGMAGSNWTNGGLVSFTGQTTNPTKGTTTTDRVMYRRVGDMLEMRVEYIQTGAGSAGSGNYYINLPAGLSIDTMKVTADTGYGQVSGASVGNVWFSNPGQAPGTLHVFDATRLYANYTNASQTTNVWSSSNYTFSGTSLNITAEIRVPIAGWDANVSMASSSTYKISSFLANGTLVTSTPTALGQYRALYKNSSGAITYADATSAPAPTIANGIVLYPTVGGGTGSTAQPSKYEVFVGKNKNVKTDFWYSTGRTGYLDTSFYEGGTTSVGVAKAYDPTTGVLVIDATPSNNGYTTKNLGMVPGSGTSAVAYQSSICYWDATISENALAVGVQAPRSELRFNTWAGWGSTNNLSPYFTNVDTNIGAALSYSNTTTGLVVTILEDGVYNVEFTGGSSAANAQGVSVSKNYASNSGATSVPAASRVCGSYMSVSSGEAIPSCAKSTFLAAGTTLRPHVNSNNTPATPSMYEFSVCKVSN